MPTQQERLTDAEKRLEAVAGEQRFQENIILRNETIISELAELSYNLKARQDVFDERMLQMMKQLQHNHEDIESLRRDQIAHATQLEAKIDTINNSKFLLIGAISVIAFVVPLIVHILFPG